MSASELDLDSPGDFSIHISGLPNSGGRHPIGNLGFSGATRGVDGNLVPFYAVQIGGPLAVGKSRFGANIGAVTAKNAPAFAYDLLAAWKESPDAPDVHQFVDREARQLPACPSTWPRSWRRCGCCTKAWIHRCGSRPQ